MRRSPRVRILEGSAVSSQMLPPKMEGVEIPGVKGLKAFEEVVKEVSR